MIHNIRKNGNTDDFKAHASQQSDFSTDFALSDIIIYNAGKVYQILGYLIAIISRKKLLQKLQVFFKALLTNFWIKYCMVVLDCC